MRKVRGTSPLLLAGLALACDDVATAPRASVRLDVQVSGQQPRHVPNAIRYRDSGRKPATGRAGGATVTTRALLGNDGKTVLEVWAGGQGGTGPGELWQVQVKKFDAEGVPRATEVEHPRGGRALALDFHDMQRGEPLQVQALVRGVSGPRTGVVTVRDAVWRRPDLMVAGIDAPSRTWTHTPTFVTAVLRELNGDVGARTSCVLDVDGAPVDEAAAIWVDAGGAVSCAFAHTFDVPGERTIRVRLAGTDPYDADPANDPATATVLVVTEVPLSYTAQADSGTYEYWRRSSWYYKTGGYPPMYSRYTSDSVGSRSLMQSARLDAWTRVPLAFPELPLADVQLSQATGGATVHAAHWASLPADNRVVTPDSSKGCVTRNSSGPVVTTFTLCTRRVGTGSYTSMSYAWNAGDVTYESVQREIITCLIPGIPDCPRNWYYRNTTQTTTGTLVPFGTTFTFDVAFVSGTTGFTARPAIPLSRMHSSWGEPWTCDGPWGSVASLSIAPMASITTCSGFNQESWRLTGMADRP